MWEEGQWRPVEWLSSSPTLAGQAPAAPPAQVPAALAALPHCCVPCRTLTRSCKENPKHKQRQGFHTDAAAAAAEQQPVVAAAAAAARGWLDGGASVGVRLWQGLP